MLVEMNDYVDGIEDLKASVGYGQPELFPFDLGLGCEGNVACAKCRGVGDWVPTEAEAKAGASKDVLGQQYFTAQKKPAATSGTDWAAYIGAAKAQFFDPYLQMRTVQAQALANRPRVVVTNEPDLVTPAVIVGGALVAGLLFFALAKK